MVCERGRKVILLQFYKQKNPRQLGGGPGNSEVIFAMTIIPENKLENKLKTKRLKKLMGERKDAKEVIGLGDV